MDKFTWLNYPDYSDYVMYPDQSSLQPLLEFPVPEGLACLKSDGNVCLLHKVDF